MDRGFFFEFNKEFEKRLPNSERYKDAFEQASDDFASKVGKAPYSSYDSFRVMRRKMRRKSK